MKEILEGLKLLLGDKVKDIYQYNQMEINLMLFKPEDLDSIYSQTETFIQQLNPAYTFTKINFINYKEEVLKSFSLLQ
ncbi:hypothetical protein [Pedobacter sp. Leaf132]|uniref:hypothetical protein n=1 Tax=Pedobacter sp. Leaf132 TaxID=2876557 RepID=UPI001E500A06|nr:hypothetical protein [Pedobacter sp. Leaf132]